MFVVYYVCVCVCVDEYKVVEDEDEIDKNQSNNTVCAQVGTYLNHLKKAIFICNMPVVVCNVHNTLLITRYTITLFWEKKKGIERERVREREREREKVGAFLI